MIWQNTPDTRRMITRNRYSNELGTKARREKTTEGETTKVYNKHKTHQHYQTATVAQLQRCKERFKNHLESNDSDSQGFIVTE